MKFVLYQWNTLAISDLKEVIESMGHEVDVIQYIFSDYKQDIEFENRLRELFKRKRYDALVSFNFFEVISRICNECCVPYIAWVWDSPQINLYSKEVFNLYNYIFVFDREAYDDLTTLGAKTLYYLPLAVNIDRLDTISLSEQDYEQYASDVTFVGSLYEDRNFYDQIPYLSEHLKMVFDTAMQEQMKVQGCDILKREITDEILEELSQYVSISMGDDYLGSERNLVIDRILANKLTSLERIHLTKKLAEKYNFVLYTGSDTTQLLPKVENKGYIDYFTVMPKVFKAAKINLNVTLRTIKTGIPLRVFDILGSEGFLITNYQKDLDKYFVNGEDLIYYDTEDELISYIDYYLNHDEERRRIARNGYEKVKKYHNYHTRLKEIFKVVFANGSSGMECNDKDQDSITVEDDRVICNEVDTLLENVKNYVQFKQVDSAKEQFLLFKRGGQLKKNGKLSILECVFTIYHEMNNHNGEGNGLFEKYNWDLDQLMQHIEGVIAQLEFLERDTLSRATCNEVYNKFVSYIEKENVEYSELISIILDKYAEPIRILNQVAKAFYHFQRYDKVLPFLIEAEEMDPDNVETLHNLIQLLDSIGEDELAKEYREKLLVK